MTQASVTGLKTNPSRVITDAQSYPVAISSHNRVTSYVLGKELFESLVAYIEDSLDRLAIDAVTSKRGKSFEKVAHELGI